MSVNWKEAATRLNQGEVGVIPTDTLYGIVGSALKPATVEHIYGLRQREREKPLIVLVSSLDDLGRLGVEVSNRTRSLLDKFWPGPVSVIVAAPGSELEYLHRGTKGIAFRMPAKAELRALLREVGPLVAPSANLAGDEPAKTVEEARAYFGDEVFYLDEGRLDGTASALVDARGENLRVLRTAPGFNVSG
jgi:L-threonylcarbamoyladenylate synthase